AMDGNGNVVALVSGTDGTKAATHEYDPFGQTIRRSGTVAAENPFRFSTKRADDAIDLVAYEYRHYRPSNGRWLNRDPIEEKGGINLTIFCSNKPVVTFDSFGQRCMLGDTQGTRSKDEDNCWLPTVRCDAKGGFLIDYGTCPINCFRQC